MLTRSSKKKKPKVTNFDNEESLNDSSLHPQSMKYLDTLQAQQKTNFGNGENRRLQKVARKRLVFEIDRKSAQHNDPSIRKPSKMPRNERSRVNQHSPSGRSPARTYSGVGLFNKEHRMKKNKSHTIWDEENEPARDTREENKENDMNRMNSRRRYKNVHHHMNKNFAALEIDAPDHGH